MKRNLFIWLCAALWLSACGDDEDKTENTCGNGYPEAWEECDDGNDIDNDACSNTCKLNCGNGTVDLGEECDDGNKIDNDACSNACKLNCGNGTVDPGEECDDGNKVDNDSCSNACKKNKCGNGALDTGEECDDGNQDNKDACTNTCQNNPWFQPNPGKKTVCGDGLIEAGEICEPGMIKEVDGAQWTCKKDKGMCVWNSPAAACGNGVVENGEECDDANNVTADGCTNKCKLEPASACLMRNGAEGQVILVIDGDTLRIQIQNDGNCSSPRIVPVRLHGLDAPECLKISTNSTILSSYSTYACDEAQKAPCDPNGTYDPASSTPSYEECLNHKEIEGYEAAKFLNDLLYANGGDGKVKITCETLSDTDPTCITDNTRNRYLAYVSIERNGQRIDLGSELIKAGYGMAFTAFSSLKEKDYCALETEAIANHVGLWSHGASFEETVKNNLSAEKQLWLLHDSHCK